MAYVVLRQKVNISERGHPVTYYPGDSVKVGRQTAEEWILRGIAVDAYGQVEPLAREMDARVATGEYGIVILAQPEDVYTEALLPLLSKVSVTYGEIGLPYLYNFIWDPVEPVSTQLINYGWLRISQLNPKEERWSMAASLTSLDDTLLDYGDEEDKEKALTLLGDLRVPVYKPGLLWIYRTRETEKFVEEYKHQLALGGSKHHCFIRALYKCQVKICTLPTDWSSI